jgi:type I restriction enzyme S subunit
VRQNDRGIPLNWIVAPVHELFDVVGGGTPPTGVAEYWQGATPWISSADIDEGHQINARRFISDQAIKDSATNRVPAGSVIVVTRVGLGKVGLTESPICFSQDSQALIFNQDLLLPKYVLLYMGTAVQIFKQIGRGTTISGVTKRQLRDLDFCLSPLPEQKRIVEEIEKQFTRLDAAVAALIRVHANLRRYRAAVLKAACEGRLVPTEAELARREGRSYESAGELLKRILTERRARWEADQLAKFRASDREPNGEKWKGKYSEPNAPDTQGLGNPPEGWVWANLGQVAWSVKDGPHYSPEYVTEGIPFITGGQVRPSGVDFGAAKEISPELHARLCQRCKPERGDILYTKGGTTGIARVNTYDIDFSVWVHVAVLKLVTSVAPFYLQHALNSPGCYKQAQAFTHGVGNQDLGLTRMVKITLGLPPLVEQKRIAAEVDRRVSFIDKLEAQVEGSIKHADRLRQAILKRAFEGRLVPQDSTDEPASVLLECIRAERVRREKDRKPSSSALSRKSRTREKK